MPQSPITPTRRRRSSGVSITQLNRPSNSRKSSVHSINSPITPFRPPSALDRSGDYGFGGEETVPEGLDNLAAELAEEDWDEEENLVEEHDLLAEDSGYSTLEERSKFMPNGTEPAEYIGEMAHTQTERPIAETVETEDKDIDESKVISKDLDDQINLVERLCRSEAPRNVKDQDVLQRVEEQLRDLSSQAKVEDQASKLMNTVDSLSKHLAHESRHLQVLLQPYISLFASPFDSTTVEALQPLITELISSIPAPPTTPLPAIHALNNSSTDILTSLAALSDNIYITQQNASIATQRLRSTRDIVQTIRQEFREADEGLQFLQAGSWEDKLRRRVAASVCDEVVNGFEQVCESWRKRLGEQHAIPG